MAKTKWAIREEKRNAQPEWLKRYVAGYEGAWTYSVWKDGESFAIVRHEGQTYWNGHMHRYAPVNYMLVDKEKAHAGHWQQGVSRELHEGRLTVEDKADITALLTQADKLIFGG